MPPAVPSLLRRHPAFARLWAAGAVSLVGDWLSFVAVSVLAISSGGGALALAIVFAAHLLPAALVSPLAGTIVDRFDRRRVLIAADLLGALVTAAMAIAAVAGSLLGVQVLLLLRSAITSLVPPGESAAVRRLVPDRDLVSANTLLAATWSVAYVAGMALGGFAALLGPALALAIDAATFAVAAAIHATLPAIPVADGESRGLLATVRATPRDTVAALRIAAAHRPLLRAVLGKAPLALAAGAAWISLNVIGSIAQPFGAAALSFGILQAVRGAGTGIGPALAGRLLRGGVSEAALQRAAHVTMLAAIVALSVARSPIALLAVALAWGIGGGSNWVLAHTALQRHANDAVIGRLAAFDELLVTLAMVLSAFAGAAVATVATPGAAALTGVALGLLGIVASDLVSRGAGRDPGLPDSSPQEAERRALG